MPADYYELLGVSRDADDDTLKRAYRRKAREHHPDANRGDPSAEARFKEISEAYAVLSDAGARARYDRFGHEGLRGGMGGPAFDFDLSDIFETFFGGNPFGGGRSRRSAGPPRGDDHETVVDLDFAEAVFGADRSLEVRTRLACDACEGTGAAPGTSSSRCSACEGIGQVRQVRQSFLGQMVTTAPCARCGGMGEEIVSPCSTCRGEGRLVEQVSLKVRVPPGVDAGSTLRLSGRGSVGPRGGPAGDLYVHLRVADSDRFVRRGDDLMAELPLTMLQAALGATVPFETLDGPIDVDVAAGTQPNETIRLAGLGIPKANGRSRGDLHMLVSVDIPKRLSRSAAAKLREVAAERGEAVAGLTADAHSGGAVAAAGQNASGVPASANNSTGPSSAGAAAGAKPTGASAAGASSTAATAAGPDAYLSGAGGPQQTHRRRKRRHKR